MTENQLRQKVVKIAVSYLGCKEADGSHRKIIDLYNSHKPLARGYAVKYTDAWCSTFASAVAIAAGLTDIIPTECGCEKHIALFKKLGAWVENDAYVPKPGDYIFYDWQDGTNYATTDNTGAADHVGIVTEVNGSTITVIEGNMSDAVGYRHIAVNGRYIRGYGVPKYASKATGADAGTTGGESGGTSDAGAGTCKVGDIVNFTGGKHYTNANAATGTACKPGKAKVTQVYQPGKAKHPYHLVAVSGGGSTVYGWVDAADIGGSASGGTRTHTVVRGDTLWALASTYLGSGSRYKEIMRLNGQTSEIIHVGQVLKMPAKEERKKFMELTLNISAIVAIIGALTVLTNIIVEVLKRATWEKMPTNLLAIIVAMVLTLVAFFGYMAFMGYAVMWYYVAAAVVVGFAVAYAAMFGFDKLKEALGQIKKNNE